MRGVDVIRIERARQLESEKFDADRDARYVAGELAEAAACYAGSPENGQRSQNWPWSWGWWKPSVDGTVEGRIKELAKAGALIAAEIDRLQRGLPDDFEHELKCNAFTVRGPSITSVVIKWFMLKQTIQQYADAQIRSIEVVKCDQTRA